MPVTCCMTHCHCISLICMTHNSCHAGHVLYDPLWLSCRSCVVWPIVTAPHPWSATVCHTYVCVTHFDWSHLCCLTHSEYVSLSLCILWHTVTVPHSCVLWPIMTVTLIVCYMTHCGCDILIMCCMAYCETPTLVKCALWPIVPVTHSCVLWYIVFCDALWLTHLCSSSVTYCDCDTLVCSRIHCDCDTLILCFTTHCDRLSCIATDTHVFCLWPIMIVTHTHDVFYDPLWLWHVQCAFCDPSWLCAILIFPCDTWLLGVRLM